MVMNTEPCRTPKPSILKLPIIRESYFLNITILVFSLFIGWFGLYFGLAHLLDPNSHTESREHIAGVIFCISLCVLGLVFLLIAFLALQGIVYKIKQKK